jgi:hypothetical protein
MIADYDELKAAIADFLNREDLTAVIPTFIKLAEADISRSVRDFRMEKRSTATVDTQYSALPADWVETLRVQITGTSSRIEMVSNGALADMRAQRGDIPGKPTHYAHTAGGLEMFPTPDAEYTIEILYYGKITSLSVAAPTNWLLTAAPDVYLYGALIQSAPYLKDDARAVVWAGMYQSAVTNQNAASDRARYSGSGLRLRTRGM